MSTRSNIARVLPGGETALRIYCHSDGYPSWNGRILLENYTTEEAVVELISHGDMSSLGATISDKHDFDDRPDNVTTYYGRDRGETNVAPKTVVFGKIRGQESILQQEYLYLWKDGAWYFSDGCPLRLLTPADYAVE